MENRAEKLVSLMPQAFEAALVQSDVNKFYLLDFEAWEAGMLVVLPKKMVYIVDARYIEAARNSVKNAEVVLEKSAPGYSAVDQALDVLKDAGVKNVHLELDIPLRLFQKMKEKAGGVNLMPDSALSDAVEALRMVKDAEEIARMREAQRITDACFDHILPYIKEGVREIDLMLEMEYFMRKNGAEKVAFDTICVAGPNTSLPHGVPGEYRVRTGNFITMDYGAKYKGYCTDMTRTVALGEPGEEKRRVYDAVLRAHMAGIAAARAGVSGFDVDKAARDVLAAQNLAQYFTHSLGHAVGAEIHENPRFSYVCKDEIKAGMMMTVEPGCYLAGKFGCRIEDTVLIEEGGCTPLPKSKKELIIL